MAEYIKKEDAIAHPFANGNYDKKHADMQFILGHESYKEWLEDLPAADVRENVEGKWECDDKDDVYILYRCSVCDYKVFDHKPKFCPNCGAYMEGAQDDQS